jgi:uncharacterized SAM-binding protein YcdF (DUF218 family)
MTGKMAGKKAGEADMRVFLAALLAIFLAYAIGFIVFVGQLPARTGKPPQADAIVVLTGGDDRLDTAVALLEHGVGKRLLISGVALETTKPVLGRISGGGARFRCCADIGYGAQDTHGNAVETAGWMQRHHFNSMILVTSRYHMPRAMAEFSASLPAVRITPWPVDQHSIDLNGWWHHAHTAAMLNREYIKFLASLMITHVIAPLTNPA